ncbi:MAG TPA: secretin N-terminal domain-containing protein [Gammaproteobacteria bacterium]|nr:secretin N-terminal domain-containing protein [Gammaproteobacteria bacterium]
MFMRWVVCLCTAVFVLVGCQSQTYNQTEGNIADVKIKATEAIRKQDLSVKPKSSLLVKSGLYVDTTPISLEKRPSWLKGHILIRGDQLPFSYYSRTIASGASNNILTKYQTGLNQSVNVSINYSGTIKGALDLLASKTGYVYSVRKNAIYWQAFITKTFDIAFMPGGTDYLMGKTSSSSGTVGAGSTSSSSAGTVSNYVSSDSSDSEYSNLKGSLSVWKDLDATIKQILSPDGRVVVSESTTSVTVRDRPPNVELVGQYIYNLNNNLSRQVLVKIQILSVNLQSDFNFGINWQLVMNAFHNSPFVVNANYGTPVAITTVPDQLTLPLGQTAFPSSAPQFGSMVNPARQNQIPSWTILLNALNQQGKTSVVSEPRVICLNNQVSVIRITKSEGYVASIQNTSTGGGGSTTAAQNTVTSQVTPGMVITGLTLYVLPKILKENIYLQVNADLSTNDGFREFGQSGSQVQLPNISAKSFNQRSLIRSGDTMILSGFRQVSNQTGATQLFNSQALGGKASMEGSLETVILITPIILHGSA